MSELSGPPAYNERHDSLEYNPSCDCADADGLRRALHRLICADHAIRQNNRHVATDIAGCAEWPEYIAAILAARKIIEATNPKE